MKEKSNVIRCKWRELTYLDYKVSGSQRCEAAVTVVNKIERCQVLNSAMSYYIENIFMKHLH